MGLPRLLRQLQQPLLRRQQVQLPLQQQLQRQLPLPFSQFGVNGANGKVAVNIAAKMVELNFDSENVFKESALGTVLIHNHVTSDHVPNGASGVSGVLVLPHVKLVPNSEFVNVKMHHTIPTAVEKVMSLIMLLVTKENVQQPRQQLQRLQQQSQQQNHQ